MSGRRDYSTDKHRKIVETSEFRGRLRKPSMPECRDFCPHRAFPHFVWQPAPVLAKAAKPWISGAVGLADDSVSPDTRMISPSTPQHHLTISVSSVVIGRLTRSIEH